MHLVVVGHHVGGQGRLPVGEDAGLIVAAFAIPTGDHGIADDHVRMARSAVHLALHDLAMVHTDRLLAQVGTAQLLADVLAKLLVDGDRLLRRRVAAHALGGSGVECLVVEVTGVSNWTSAPGNDAGRSLPAESEFCELLA